MSFNPYLHLLRHCGNLQSNEKFLLISDATTEHLTSDFLSCADRLGAQYSHIRIKVADRHGVEPGLSAENAMVDSDLVAALTYKSIAHTNARR